MSSTKRVTAPEDGADRSDGRSLGQAVLVVAAVIGFLADTCSGVLTRSFDPIGGPIYSAAQAALLVAGLVGLQRGQRENGRLMLGIVLVNAVTDVGLTVPGIGPLAFVNDAFQWLEDVMLGHLLLRWPRPRLQTRAQRLVTLVAYVAFVPLMVVDDLLWTPAWSGLPRSTWWPTVFPDRALSVALFRVGLAFFGLLLVAFVVLVIVRIAHASRPERRELSAVGVSIGLVVVSGALTAAADLGAPVGSYLPFVISDVALATVPLTFLASIAVRRVQRAMAIEALASHGRDVDESGVVRELRRAMGDRYLDVAIYSIDAGRYITADGAPAPEIGTGRKAVFVASGDGSPLARLDVTSALAERRELSGPIADVAVVALESSRLRAELRVRATAEETARRQLEAAAEEGARLSRMLPGGVPEKLRADPGALGRIDAAEVSVVMSDVRGYTTIAERAAPAQLAQQLREHRSAMNEAILAEGGTVMQYVGDAVMAVFGAPFAQPDHAARAVRAAAAMHAAQAMVDARWLRQGWSPFLLGIGVSSGEVATAVIGSEERYEYTIVGDTVNLAQRLEDQARPGGTTILSDATLRSAGEQPFEVEALAPLLVKGRAAAVQAFRVVAEHESEAELPLAG